ncbi:hypothetical protein NL676_023959 [Syzygium grande]|nr:hypothetical protein NL676_023959 [Syzygium grande]
MLAVAPRHLPLCLGILHSAIDSNDSLVHPVGGVVAMVRWISPRKQPMTSCEPVTAGVPPPPIGSRGFPARARIGVQVRRFPAVDCGGGREGLSAFAGVGSENSRGERRGVGSELGLRGEEDLDVVLFGRVQLQEEDVQESAEEGLWARDQGQVSLGQMRLICSAILSGF